MDKYIIIIILAFIIFLFSLEISTFGGYTIPILLFAGIIIYFLSNYIGKLMQNRNTYLVSTIIIIISVIILLIAYGINAILENKKNIDADWNDYKCKPYIMPFAGWIIGPNTTNPSNNFIDCLWDINQNFFEILISPFKEMLSTIFEILTGLTDDVQNIRKMITYMRENIIEMAQDIYQRLYETYERIAYIVKKILEIFDKLFDVFDDTFSVLLYSFYTLASIWNGPIGETPRVLEKIKKFFCFDGNTLILLNDLTLKKIKNVKNDDILDHDNKILARMKLLSDGVQMYNYFDIIVSGSHIVKENNQYIKVEQSKNAIKIKYNKEYIYCLVTENARIPVNNGIIFKDYYEAYGKIERTNKFKTYLKKINKSKNQIKIRYKDLLNDYLSGFCGKTLIIMADGTYKPLKNIKIGDHIKNGGIVLGKIKINPEKIKLFNFNDVILSGTSITFLNKWKPIYKIDNLIPIQNNYKKLYHLITENKVININDQLFADFSRE